MREQWRKVEGFGGRYEVSHIGNVRSTKLVKGGVRTLKTWLNGRKYVRVDLVLDSKTFSLYVHELVAEAFLGARPVGLQVNHKNLDKTDNRASNLEWVTPQENVRHAVARGHDSWMNRRSGAVA